MFDRFRVLLVLGLFPVLLVGCSSRTFWTTAAIGGAAAAGAATVYYVTSDAETDSGEELESVYKAALEVLQNNKFTVQENTLNALEGEIVAQIPGEDGKTTSLTIKIKMNDDKSTHISVRVGVVGNEILAREILEDIERAL